MSMTGWQCPKCGRVYSPIVFECKSCNKKVTDKVQTVDKRVEYKRDA